MIFMKINFKKLNFGQLILVKISDTAATKQHKIILKLKFTKFDFRWGLLRGKRSFGLHARRWYGQQIGLPICLFTSLVMRTISALITLQSALCCALSVLSCVTVAGSAVLQLQA